MMIQNNRGSNRPKEPLWKTILISLLYIGGFILAGFMIRFSLLEYWSYLRENNIPLEERGQIGDTFGAMNALFSGLAFAALIVTLLLQRRELQLQREELEATTEELKRSADAQQKTEQSLRTSAWLDAAATRIRLHDDSIRNLKSSNMPSDLAKKIDLHGCSNEAIENHVRRLEKSLAQGKKSVQVEGKHWVIDGIRQAIEKLRYNENAKARLMSRIEQVIETFEPEFPTPSLDDAKEFDSERESDES